MNSCVHEGQEGHPFLGLSRAPLKTKPFVYCELCIVYCLLYIWVLFILHSVDILCSVLYILFAESLKTIKVSVCIEREICQAALD